MCIPYQLRFGHHILKTEVPVHQFTFADETFYLMHVKLVFLLSVITSLGTVQSLGYSWCMSLRLMSSSAVTAGEGRIEQNRIEQFISLLHTTQVLSTACIITVTVQLRQYGEIWIVVRCIEKYEYTSCQDVRAPQTEDGKPRCNAWRGRVADMTEGHVFSSGYPGWVQSQV